MTRLTFAIAALALATVATGTAGAPASAIPTRAPVTLSGRFLPPRGVRDVFVLRVLARGPGGFPEILAERTLERGSFSVTFPLPGGPYLVLVTSRDHEPIVLPLRGKRRSRHLRRPIVPRTWLDVAVEPRTDAGPIREGTIVFSSIRNDLAPFRNLPLLQRRATIGKTGRARVRCPANARISLRVRSTTAAGWGWFETGDDCGPPRLIEVGKRVPGHLVLDVAGGERGETPVDPATVRVVAGTPNGGVPLKGARWGSGWAGLVPPGTTWVRVEAKGFRPQVIHDYEPRESSTRRSVRLRRPGGHPMLTIRTRGGSPPLASATKRSWCGTCSGSRRPNVRLSFQPAGPPGPGAVGTREQRQAVRPGRTTVILRGPLGFPVRRTYVVAAGTDVRDEVDAGGGSGIRLVVRDARGLAPARISFRVLDAAGKPVRVEITSPDGLGEPVRWSFEGTRLRGVPNGGLVRIAPGTWTVEVARKDGGVARFAVRTLPDLVTRLDTAFRGERKGGFPKMD